MRPRRNRPPTTAQPVARKEEQAELEFEAATAPAVRVRMPLLVLYGSNTRTCETIAHRIGEDATIRSFSAIVAELDAYVGKLPTNGAVVIVTASYNGTPPDDVAKFVEWLSSKSLTPDALAGVRYTVFGCGDHDWADTFQRIPRLIDTKLEEHGAERIHPRGEGDQSDDIDSQFRHWYDDLFDSLAKTLNVAAVDFDEAAKGPRYEVKNLEGAEAVGTLVAEFGARPLTIAQNRELQRKDGPKPSERSTRHVEFRVPAGLSYREGDHLGVLPRNSKSQVRRVLAYFGLPEDARGAGIRFNGVGKSFLPVDRPMPVTLLLSGYLAHAGRGPPRSDIEVLAEYAEAPAGQGGADSPSAPRTPPRAPPAIASTCLRGDRVAHRPARGTSRPARCRSTSSSSSSPILKPRYYSITSSPLVTPSATAASPSPWSRVQARSGHGAYRGGSPRAISPAWSPSTAAECFVRAVRA